MCNGTPEGTVGSARTREGEARIGALGGGNIGHKLTRHRAADHVRRLHRVRSVSLKARRAFGHECFDGSAVIRMCSEQALRVALGIQRHVQRVC